MSSGVLAVTLAQWWIWAALTPVVLWLSRRFALEHGTLLARVPLHVGFGIVVAVEIPDGEGLRLLEPRLIAV